MAFTLPVFALGWRATTLLTRTACFLLSAFKDNPLSFFQTVNRIAESLRDAVRVTARDLGVARSKRRGRVAQASLQAKRLYAIGYSHLDIAEVCTEQERLYLFVAIAHISKFAYAELQVDQTRTRC